MSPKSGGIISLLGLERIDSIVDADIKDLELTLKECFDEMGVPPDYPEGKPERGIFCSRTLNSRSIKCIGN